MTSLKSIEERVEAVEVIINRHSPMVNFDIKEQCAREIVKELLTSDRHAIGERILEWVRSERKKKDGEIKIEMADGTVHSVRAHSDISVGFNAALDKIETLIKSELMK